jgi:hypothetical protein
MARSRSLPTNLFEDPDFFDRSSNTQAILVGLVLGADDYGRGLAHAGLLARKFNKEVHLVEQALDELATCELLVCYQVGRHRYYTLTRWQEWQTLHKPTPSRYPAPPCTSSPQTSEAAPVVPQLSPENSGEIRATLSEGEAEQEEKGMRNEDEGEGEVRPPNVVTFPATRSDGDEQILSEHKKMEMTQQVAAILHLPVTPALTRLVEEYRHDDTLSLLGEADAARAWIDDRKRNRTGKPMTEAFYRNWLKREQTDAVQRRAQRYLQATGTTGKQANAMTPGKYVKGAGPPISSSGAEDPYRAFVLQRTQELNALASASGVPGGAKA